MEQRRLGRTGLMVSRLALGTWTWGQETDSDDAAGQLKMFLDAGGTLVDTADVYASGQSLPDEVRAALDTESLAQP
jgi:aryl-alcohol dehydrogenase-like predicted oxidoreductase